MPEIAECGGPMALVHLVPYRLQSRLPLPTSFQKPVLRSRST
jgi:hypothetical protein